jgi:hypothetical protein
VACGVFGIGVSCEQDFVALQRFNQHLVPGGVLILEHHPPYRDAHVWPLWRKEARTHLPEPWPEYVGNVPQDEHEYELHYRLVSIDPLNQQSVGEMRTLLFKEKQLVEDNTRALTSNYYFRNELHLLLENAGFKIEAEKGDWTDADATADHDVIIYFARK